MSIREDGREGRPSVPPSVAFAMPHFTTPYYARARLAMPHLPPVKAAERAEALSADISRTTISRTIIDPTGLDRCVACHIWTYTSDASSESAMLGSPVADADQLASIDSDLFDVAQVENIRIK